MLKFVLVLLCAVAAYAQIPQPCFSPPELTFRADQYNHEFTTFRHFHTEYDVHGERVAFHEIEETGVQPGRQYYILIFLHRENVVYEYNRQTKQCRRSPAGRFRQFGVPEDARFEFEFYIGGGSNQVEGVAWSDRSDVREAEWHGVFSRIHCYPLRTFLRNGHNNETITTLVYDLVSGISDPDYFLPPQECLNATIDEPSTLARSLRSMYTGKYW